MIKPWKIVSAAAMCLLHATAFGADVRMAFGEKIPPFVFPETNSGIEIEVIGQALAYKGHRLIPEYFPFARIPLEFKAGAVDAAMTDLGTDRKPYGAHYGKPAVFYDNQALQVLTLERGRYDVVLSDRDIFKYFSLKLKREQGLVGKATEEHRFVVFNPLDYRPLFHDSHVRDDFNAGLLHLKQTGGYQAIYDKYLKE